MVARAIGYYGDPFKGYCGVTQGDQLLPKIFNFMLDVVFSHWPTIVAEETNGSGMIPIHSELGGLLLICRKWSPCVNATIMYTVVVQRPDREF